MSRTPAQNQAARDLQGILVLRARPEFNAFLDRMKAQADKEGAKLLTGNFATPDELWNARKVYDGWRAALDFFANDEKTCRSLLGLRPGEAPDIL